MIEETLKPLNKKNKIKIKKPTSDNIWTPMVMTKLFEIINLLFGLK